VHGLLGKAEKTVTPVERLPLLRQALTYWRGTPLADVVESPYLSHQANSLEELKTATQENCLTDHLRLGQHQEVIPELDSLSSANPFRERLVRLLMTALFRDGRAADALAAYRRLSELLRDELGIVPARPTTALHGRIQRGDVSLLTPPGRYSYAEAATNSPESIMVSP
jgi:DNA-binding SARP family transcriptional activator